MNMAIASLANTIRNMAMNMLKMLPAIGKCIWWYRISTRMKPMALNTMVQTSSFPVRAVAMEFPAVFIKCLEVPYLSSVPNEYIRTMMTIISSIAGSRMPVR